MKIRCPHCEKTYTIQEELLKTYKGEITLPCPNCKGKILIDMKGLSSSETQSTKPSSDKVEEEIPNKAEGQALKERIFKTLKDLPPMPQVAQKARKVLSDPNSSFTDLAKIIETDQGIVTRVLKMANSAYYGMSGNVSSVQHASLVLGSKTLMELLNLACSSEILGKNLQGYDLEAGDLWMHSLAVANASQIIAKKTHPHLEQDAFSAGLIHDVGKIILDPYINERKKEFQFFVQDGKESFLYAEKKILGFDHAELASEVCELWQIPEHIALSIRYHHDPEPSNGDDLSYIVHMADAIAIMSGIGAGIDGMLYRIHDKAMDHLHLSQDDILEIMAEVAQYVEKITQEV
ncbi:MAG: zinc-ribbon domain-containing protein [Deltaproteobacteria bacterium]|nr:zinc-ribbon domain-containing protein [Deltaproteobacteria bacterium]